MLRNDPYFTHVNSVVARLRRMLCYDKPAAQRKMRLIRSLYFITQIKSAFLALDLPARCEQCKPLLDYI